MTQEHCTAFPQETRNAAVCVVGGGMAGLCAALASARSGVATILLQDRAVLGGNASSEVRMWICGAHGPDNKEAGILEEIQLLNWYRNPDLRYPIWDSVLYEIARSQTNLTLILSAAVCRVEMASPARIAAVEAWHLTRQCWLRIEADYFIDCSGDSVLRISGADHRWGREAQADCGEPGAPLVADRKTMGNSILLQLREIDPAQHQRARIPAWARSIPADHPRVQQLTPTGHNFWWCEIGGEDDTIADADRIRDELMAIAWGVWGAIKNHPDGRGQRWALEWIGALPGKRENVRYEGDHLLTQGDIESCGRFPDVVAYGGWTMDDHPPAAFDHCGNPTTHWPAPSPFGIPWRCLYSRNIDNLLCAGRNISCTHMAMSATRVMGTCSLVGQAAGIGAALALRYNCTPRTIGEQYLPHLQQRLLDADCWLPGLRRSLVPLTRAAAVTVEGGSAAALADGIERRLEGDWHSLELAPGAAITMVWPQPVDLQRLRMVVDSQLHRPKVMPCSWPLSGQQTAMPAPLLRDGRIEVADDPQGPWRCVGTIRDNYQRLIERPLRQRAACARIVIEGSWGGGPVRVFAAEFGLPEFSAQPESGPWPSSPVRRSGRGA